MHGPHLALRKSSTPPGPMNQACPAVKTWTATSVKAHRIETKRSCIKAIRQPHCRAQPNSFRHCTCGRSRVTHRLVHHAQWPMCGRKEQRFGAQPKDHTACERTSREYSEFLKTSCASYSSTVPVRTAVTGTTMRLPMRCCFRGLWENLCACSGRAKTSTRGIPRGRRRYLKYTEASTMQNALPPGK